MEEEDVKQKRFQKILNMLTPENVKEVFEQVLAVKLYDVVTLDGLVSQIFKKALMESISCEMYVNLCSHLAAALPIFILQDNKTITFKRLLINKCQEVFEKETNDRRRRLGNIRIIGELYNKEMFAVKIVYHCIQTLLDNLMDPDKEEVEALYELMSTIMEKIDQPKNKKIMDLFYEKMKSLSNNGKLSSRVRFMLKGVIDLRNNKWQKRLAEGPIIFDGQPDLLLKHAVQRTDLLEIAADIAEADQMENLKCHLRERFSQFDTSILCLDFRMKRLENYHQDASRFRIFLIMLFVLNTLVMLYFYCKASN